MTASATLHPVDIHEADYCALNCRSGIIAGILEDQWSVDPSPMYFRIAISPLDVLAPMERGEIAGFTFGNISDEAWTELFDTSFEQWRSPSPDEMSARLDAELARGVLVLASHDGYYDPLAADKYHRRHTRHNSMIFGVTPDGSGYLIADRGCRSTVSKEILWQCMAPEMSFFVAVRGASPYRGDLRRLAAAGARALRDAVTYELTDEHRASIAGAVVADVAARHERWQQTHAFFAGVGRSRGLFAQALRRMQPDRADPLNDATAWLCEVSEASADAWLVLSRLLYKHTQTGALLATERLARKLAEAGEADLGVARALSNCDLLRGGDG